MGAVEDSTRIFDKRSCRYPQLLSSVFLGVDDGSGGAVFPGLQSHEGSWAPDGLTYYARGVRNYYAIDTTDLTSQVLLAAQQGNAPDVLIVDNPVFSTLAEPGLLASTDDNKIDTSSFLPNLLGAGQSGGKPYAVPIGANTLALY